MFRRWRKWKPGMSRDWFCGSIEPRRAGTGHLRISVSRMAAIFDAGFGPSPFAPPGPYKATFEGDINMRLRDFLIFSAEGSGKLTITINDKPALDLFGNFSGKTSEPIRLGKGKNKIVAVYAPMPNSDGEFRLFWGTKTTPPEPVPPMVLSHSNADKPLREDLRVREGKALVEEFRCVNCHDFGIAAPDARPMPELGMDAPSLEDAGSRLEPDWMAAWIANPKAIWPGAHMPRVFKPAAAGEMSSEAKDIAAYLGTLARNIAANAAGCGQGRGRRVAVREPELRCVPQFPLSSTR